MTTSSRPELKLAFCDHKAATYAVMNWHYSKRMPAGTLVKIGVWEGGQFIGVVIFGHGAIPQIGDPYRLSQREICELVRVALRSHVSPVSRILAIALKMLRQSNPGMRLVISYADSGQGHHGGIYQAGNWVYAAASQDSSLKIHGVLHHRRSISSQYGTQKIAWLRANVDPNAKLIPDGLKHRYLYPLDALMREQIAPLSKPYPKRVGSVDSDTPGNQPGEGSATLTPTLQTQER